MSRARQVGALIALIVGAACAAYPVGCCDDCKPAKPDRPLVKPAPFRPFRPFRPQPDCPDGKCPRNPQLLIEEAPSVDMPGVILPMPVNYVPGGVGFDVGGPAKSGKEVEVDLPTGLHRRNTSSRGLGNCVFTSLHHSALWQAVTSLMEFPKWLIDKGIPGGGYPSKVADLIPKIAADRGLPTPAYVQHTGGDEEFLRLALHTGRCPAVTYSGRDGVYYRGDVAHMVNLVYLDEADAVILDNNYPGQYLWMTRAQFLARWRAMGGGWAVVLLNPPPPPVPTNGRPSVQQVQCPGGQCPIRPATPVPLAVNPAEESWGWSVTEPGVRYFSRGSMVVGKLYPDGSYQTWNGSAWVVESAPTSAPAAGAEPELAESHRIEDNYGVDVSKITPGPYYERSGREVNRQEAFAAMEDSLTDDSQTPRLTIVSGDESARDRLADEVRRMPEAAGLIVHAYDPAHWHVRDVGFREGVYLQAASRAADKGRVIWRHRTMPTAQTLRVALRKADPNYDPDNDPDPERTPSVPSLSGVLAVFGRVPWWAWVALAVGIYFWRSPRPSYPTQAPATVPNQSVPPRPF